MVGSTSLFFVSLWMPLLLIFFYSLWVQRASLHWIQGQRALDRCVNGIHQKRCENLNRLSQSNLRLIQILRAAEAAWGLQAVPHLAPAARATLETLRKAAAILVTMQNKSIQYDTLLLGGYFQCGLPSIQTQSHHLPRLTYRPQNPMAKTLHIDAPLAWSPHLQKSNHSALPFLIEGISPWITFGSCHTPTDPLLRGEIYTIDFRRPAPSTRDKSSSSRYLFGFY